MDDARLGSAIRVVRIREKRTQAEVAKAAGVRRYDVSRVERGSFDHLPIGALRAIAAVLGIWIGMVPNWRGAALDRVLNSAHTALQEAVIRFIEEIPGWVTRAEVSFSIAGERGVVDVLAWHARTRTLLIIELKTLVVDPADLVRTMGRRTRLAHQIALSQGWRPDHVASWVVFTDTRTNRRQVAHHRDLLKVLGGLDGRSVRAWLRSPIEPMSAMSFWHEPNAVVVQHVRRATGKPLQVAGSARESRRGAVSQRRP
jgi:transcriptional regulator with XRE-family HTH domain